MSGLQARTRGVDAIRNSFTTAERARFHNLLKLAAESPYEGERTNALAAAGRLAARHGMTLAEAAAAGPGSARRAPDPTRPERPGAGSRSWEDRPWEDRGWTAADMARFVHLMDWQIYVAKQRRDAALREARLRGLDAEDPPPPPRPRRVPRPNHAGRNPWDHARVLLTETSLRLHEIVEITGLDIYQIVGFKLKLERGL
jgi:hypothetical protein